jgi:hypothetical protein
VRYWPFVTLDGREFKYPYKKRINVTLNALNDKFLDEWCNKIDAVVKETYIHMVVQMGLGGGAYRAKGNEKVGDLTITSIPHRNYVYSFVFDLFYEDGHENRAIQLQDEMQRIIEAYGFNNDSQERRFFWGTFGDTHISDPKIRNMYYDNEEDYKELQKLKKKVDPDDVFHTDLTVQLPMDSKMNF